MPSVSSASLFCGATELFILVRGPQNGLRMRFLTYGHRRKTMGSTEKVAYR